MKQAFICFSNLFLSFDLSVPDGGCSGSASCTLSLLSTFVLIWVSGWVVFP